MDSLPRDTLKGRMTSIRCTVQDRDILKRIAEARHCHIGDLVHWMALQAEAAHAADKAPKG